VPETENGHSEGKSPVHLTVLIPVFNDWAVAALLVDQLDQVFDRRGMRGTIVFVDDGSIESPGKLFTEAPFKSLDSIQVLELKRNLGHQRALCVGLVHLYQSEPKGPVLIMDADGEDRPADIALLLHEYLRQGERKIIFAARSRRAEGFIFRLFYQFYRAIHRVLVGFDIRIGNFSLIPSPLLERLVVTSDLWNHYAAAATKIRMPCSTIPIDRAKRISGQSKMDFVGLIVHGLSAISVFGDVVGVRLLICSAVVGVLSMGLILATLVTKLFTHLAIPGWATYTTGLLLLLMGQCVLFSLIFTFGVLYSRGQSSFLPLRDCPFYIHAERKVFTKHDE
jgi:glycosyltransferase involved in cell wall biosynthesis